MNLKPKLGLRVSVLLLFLILYVASIVILNNYFVQPRNRMVERLVDGRFAERFAECYRQVPRDDEITTEVLIEYRQVIASIAATQHRTNFYSLAVVLILMAVSSTLFIFGFYIITHPLKELQVATAKIREGDFSVYLPPTGTSEIRLLKQSFNDMSRELESVQDKLLQAEKEMIWKELSRILAHEIKNPLTPIQLSVQRLEEKYTDDPERFVAIFPECAGIINQEILNLRGLVQSFSTFAKISQPETTVFDPTDTICEILRGYESSYSLKKELVKGHLIAFDKTHFYQIFTNIIQNAIDASPPEGTILISLRQSRSYLVLDIVDQGQGISPEDLGRIFEPYFTRKKRGTGLGLALVKRLSDANGAIIRAKSKPGDGTTFELIIEEYREHPDS
ncbi:MAG: HAMP domain-containing protein [Candidatus Cloacimonetes bacterium]|nr:HAMP domain-containing protein [Candidatus Cloacimonadota bacterium]